MNFIQALFRLITLHDLRQSWKLNKAGDEVFTGSAEGRAAAFDIAKENMLKDFNEFESALSEAELAVEVMNGRLKELEATRATTQKALDGAVKVYSDAKASGDTAKMEKSKADGTEYQSKIAALTAEIDGLNGEIAAHQEGFKALERKYAKMKQDIANLPAEKAKSIANFISKNALIKAQKRLDGLLTKQEESPLDAVRQADLELNARAKVVTKLGGADKSDDEAAYIKAAEGENAGDAFDNLVAAKTAEKASATGEPAAAVTEDRAKF
ncbi:MAG: hypothetical protein IPP57_09200 [Candidatus Obscuribacter sp.]|jgi:chromosome segregation ATPase|nr:hypothetical protein [Candidatus Obscuribacter sp.]MDQ5964991.1 hypothetical protein [Cyanobacteriota bacterium erpe_2018_sw_39hr_WHONDRS-SW48-000098_B_bin.30]